MFYVDTSLIVASLSNEAATARAQEWLEAHGRSTLLTSDWTITEASSAVALRLRAGTIGLEERAGFLAQFHRLMAESFRLVPVTGGHFRTAARFVDNHALGLRAGDALHLAVAADIGAMVGTLDRRMAAAASALGVLAEMPA
jgi:predicted nucleic acid-binding protein